MVSSGEAETKGTGDGDGGDGGDEEAASEEEQNGGARVVVGEGEGRMSAWWPDFFDVAKDSLGASSVPLDPFKPLHPLDPSLAGSIAILIKPPLPMIVESRCKSTELQGSLSATDLRRLNGRIGVTT